MRDERSSSLVASFLQPIRATLLALLVAEGILSAEPIPVRHPEATAHGFLAVRTAEGKTIGGGDLIQVSDGNRITLKVTLRFKDGSIDDETAVYSQKRVFRLISDHLVQRGPSFPNPIDMSLETATGNVTVHFIDADGRDSVNTDHFDFPPDVANGLLLTLVKNIGKNPETRVAFLTAERKPMLVKLLIWPFGKEKFRIGESYRKANRFIVRVQLEGVVGLLASVLKQQPPDTYVWISDGEAPTVLKLQGPAYIGGPVWVTEVASPEWPGE